MAEVGSGEWSFGSKHSRRDLLRFGVGALGTLLIPGRPAWAARTSVRSLSLYAVHTGEAITADYVVGGRYQDDALEEVARVLRDHRTGDVHPIDPGVLDLLFSVSRMVDSDEPFHVISGYRSPETNERNRLSRRHSGVARDSFHLYGRAIDVFLPRRRLSQVRGAAIALAAGGVGYYPRSGFVHVDTGPLRTW